MASLAYDAAAIDGIAYVDPAIDAGCACLLSCARASGIDNAAGATSRLVAELPDDDDSPARLQAPVERISQATAHAFTLDPASCATHGKGPNAPCHTRASDSTRCSVPTQRIPLRAATHGRAGGLYSRCGQTRAGPGVGCDPDDVQRIVPGNLPVRSDDLAAAHAWLRGDELMRRFRAYRIKVEDYFKFAKLPLIIRHRAPLKGAGAGISVNAQVRPDSVGAGVLAVPPRARRWR